MLVVRISSTRYKHRLHLDKLKAEKSLRIGIEMENRFLDFNPAMNLQPPQVYQTSHQAANYYHHPLPSIQTTSQFPFQFNSAPIGSNSSDIQEIKFK